MVILASHGQHQSEGFAPGFTASSTTHERQRRRVIFARTVGVLSGLLQGLPLW
jgi:hypothetical protein